MIDLYKPQPECLEDPNSDSPADDHIQYSAVYHRLVTCVAEANLSMGLRQRMLLVELG